MGDQGTALFPQGLEEPVQGGHVPSRRRPDQAPGVVVDDHGDEAVPALVGDLVDPDAPEALEAVDPGVDVGRYPGDDRPDTSPGDAHELGDRRLGGLHGEPGDTVIEVAGVSGVVACPGDLRHRRAVGGTVDPHRRALQEAPHPTQIHSPPVPPALPLVIARRPGSTAPAPAPSRPPRAHMDHDRVRRLVEDDLLDHRRPVDTDHPTPYVGIEHAISSPRLQDLQAVRKLDRSWRCSRQGEVRSPTDVSGDPHKGGKQHFRDSPGSVSG